MKGHSYLLLIVIGSNLSACQTTQTNQNQATGHAIGQGSTSGSITSGDIDNNQKQDGEAEILIDPSLLKKP